MEEYNIQEEPAKRPEMLTILCVLSFINAVWNALSNFISFVFYDTIKDLFSKMSSEEMLEELGEEMGDEMIETWTSLMDASSSVFAVGRGYYFFEMVLFIASFVGVLMMWKLWKRGFHIYAIAQILMLIVTSIFVINKIGGGFPLGAIFWTALFVIMYYAHYKKVMK